MLVKDLDSALSCVLFPKEIIVLAKALHNYGELCHEEIKAADEVGLLEALETTLELAAHAVELASRVAHPVEVRVCAANVRRNLGYYDVPDERTIVREAFGMDIEAKKGAAA